MNAREKAWKQVSWGECLHCGGEVEVFTDLDGEKAYDSDKARCSECGCPASVCIDESMDAPDGDDGTAYLNWHDEAPGECDCVWCKQQAIVEALREENSSLKKQLTSALTVPEGRVRTPDGVDRKVLGKPAFDRDGRMVGFEGVFWTEHCGNAIKCHLRPQLFCYVGIDMEFTNLALVPDQDCDDKSQCHVLYSDRAAALAAKKEPNDE